MASEALQAEGELGGKLLPRWLILRLLLLGQQQLGFEIGEPRRHHEIIGGDLKAQRAGGFDIVEILLGEPEDRKLGQIDLLVAREHQQQVERAFEPVKLKNENVVIVGFRHPFGRFPIAGQAASAAG